MHAWRLAEQHFQIHVYCVIVKQRIGNDELQFGRCNTKYRARTPFTIAYALKQLERFWRNGNHVSLLRLVTPDFFWRHAGLFGLHRSQVKPCARATTMRKLRQGVGKATRADIVNTQYGIGISHGPAGVDHFLTPAFHLGVGSLHGIEVQRLRIGARCHRGCGTATQADTHPRPANLHQQCAGRKRLLVRVCRRDIAEAACDHDRLVVSAHDPTVGLLVTTEISGEIDSPEFVVERRSAEWTIDHNL